MEISANALKRVLFDLTDKQKFCIAYSGGIDSQVLLVLMSELCQQQPHYSIRAVYINHGLHKNADAWQMHCKSVCEELRIPFSAFMVNIEKISGGSIEALARDARYRCLDQQLLEDECLLTAHNADDQAETLLLQLLRGAGVSGLAAMPIKKSFAKSLLLRPLLLVNRAQIESYAKKNQLRWIEDESNLDLRFDRNYVRHQIMPVIKARWPEATKTMARSSQHCGDAKRFLFDVATQDFSFVLLDPDSIDVDKLLDLSLIRQEQVIRYWILQRGFMLPTTLQLEQIFKNVINSRYDATPCVEWSSQQIRRYRHRLYLMKKPKAKLRLDSIHWNLSHDLILPYNLGVLKVDENLRGGLKLPLANQCYSLRFRQGGELIKPAGRKEHHTLKKLMQEWGIPPWLRGRIPLLYCNDELIAVIGYCIAEEFMAGPEELGLMVRHINKLD